MHRLLWLMGAGPTEERSSYASLASSTAGLSTHHGRQKSYKDHMNKIQHPSNNGVLGAPAGWDQNQLPCSALPITRTEWDGVPAIVSFWKPTPEELEALNKGAAVFLSIVGNSMPPVAIGVEQG